MFPRSSRQVRPNASKDPDGTLMLLLAEFHRTPVLPELFTSLKNVTICPM